MHSNRKRSTPLKKIGLAILILILAALSYVLYIYIPQLPVANGYAAKKMCSCTFIAGREQAAIQREDLGFSPLSLTKTKIDLDARTATSSVFGLRPRTAEFREKAGCVLIQGEDDYNVRINHPSPVYSADLTWPNGSSTEYDSIPSEINQEQLNEAILSAFDPGMAMDSMKTRAVVVIYKDQLVGEAYANGYDENTALLGWSMTKSITSTLIGILVKNGMMSLSDQNLFDHWTDDRKEITLQDMLQMQSGLSFSEIYNGLSDATRMLFMSEDVSQIPGQNLLIHSPGTHWAYSSGTTNLLARLIRNELGNDEEYWQMPYDSLFSRIGMTSAIIETDESGNFIGSSYCYATPRDWAKFGLLYLNQGNWYGDQLVDSSWVDFVRQPASNSNGIYGGQFWLNVNHSSYPDAPEDLFSCNGFEGQYIFIMPSHDLIIVRMGLAEWPSFDANKLIKEVMASIQFQ